MNTDALTDLLIKTYQTISEDMQEINTSELKEFLNKLNRNDLEVIENSTTQIQRYTSKLSMIGIGIRFNLVISNNNFLPAIAAVTGLDSADKSLKIDTSKIGTDIILDWDFRYPKDIKGSLDLDLKGINSSIQTVLSIENLAECMTSKYSPDRTLASNSRTYFYLIRRFDDNKDTAEIKFNQTLPDELLLRLKEIITSEGIWSSKFKYIQLWRIFLNMWALKLISDDKSSLIYTDYCTYRVAHLISHMSRIKVEKDKVSLNDREFKVKIELLEEIIDKMFKLLDTEMVQRRDPVSESDLLLNVVDSSGTQLIFTPEYTEAVKNLKRPLEALMNTVLI